MKAERHCHLHCCIHVTMKFRNQCNEQVRLAVTRQTPGRRGTRFESHPWPRDPEYEFDVFYESFQENTETVIKYLKY